MLRSSQWWLVTVLMLLFYFLSNCLVSSIAPGARKQWSQQQHQPYTYMKIKTTYNLHPLLHTYTNKKKNQNGNIHIGNAFTFVVGNAKTGINVSNERAEIAASRVGTRKPRIANDLFQQQFNSAGKMSSGVESNANQFDVNFARQP